MRRAVRAAGGGRYTRIQWRPGSYLVLADDRAAGRRSINISCIRLRYMMMLHIARQRRHPVHYVHNSQAAAMAADGPGLSPASRGTPAAQAIRHQHRPYFILRLVGASLCSLHAQQMCTNPPQRRVLTEPNPGTRAAELSLLCVRTLRSHGPCESADRPGLPRCLCAIRASRAGYGASHAPGERTWHIQTCQVFAIDTCVSPAVWRRLPLGRCPNKCVAPTSVGAES